MPLSAEIEYLPKVHQFEPSIIELVTHLPVGVYQATPRGEVTWANSTLLQMFACSSLEELSDALVDSDIEFLCHRSEIRTQVDSQDQVNGFESEWRLKNGQHVSTRENLRAVRDQLGEIQCYAGTVEKTPRRNGAARLDGNDLLRALMENSPDTIYFKDNSSRFIQINRAQATLLGLESTEDAIGKSDFDFFNPEHAQDALADEQLLIESRQPVIDKIEHVRSGDGEFRWVSATKVPMFSDSGEVIGIAGISRDITDRKNSEIERQVLFRIMEGVSSCDDLRGQLQLIHEAISEVVDARNCFVALVDPTTNLMHFEFYVDDHDPKPQPLPMHSGLTGLMFKKNAPLLLTFEQQKQLMAQGEIELIGSLSESWLGVPLRTPNAVIGALVIQSYISAKVFKQKDLEFLASVGSQIAIIIERKMAQDRLQRTADQLARSNRELEDFASIASHDLQEPLRKIRAFGDRLTHKCAEQLTDVGRDYLERMQNAAERMQTLINDLLTFSRVTSKAQPFKSIDLNVVVREVLTDLEVRIEEAGGTVTVSQLPVIDADPLQMRQLFQNLIANALKFRKPDEPPVVKIFAESTTTDDSDSWSLANPDMWHLSVADNGIGFDEKYLDRIFTVFQRLHGRNVYEGTGVGLAVCRRIAERHNGSITATSQPDNGSTFIVKLPAKQHKGSNE